MATSKPEKPKNQSKFKQVYGWLTVRMYDDAFFVHYKPPNASSDNGGYIGVIWPGGHFHGFYYEQLFKLGDGTHRRILDERKPSEPGIPKPFASERHERKFDFDKACFYYSVGAVTQYEVHNAFTKLNPEDKDEAFKKGMNTALNTRIPWQK